MHRRIHCIAWTACLLTMLLSGCATTYKYENHEYTSAEAALSAVRRDMQSQLASIQPGVPLAASADIYIPDRQRIAARGVVTTGAVRPGVIEYVTEVLFLGFEVVADSLDRARVFERLNISVSSDPAYAAGASQSDYAIWLDLRDPSTAQWYLSRRGSGAKTPMPMDTGVERSRRGAAWTRQVRDVATIHGASAVARADVSAVRSSETPDSSGSGFVINRGGYILTNAHVVDGCTRIVAKRDGKSFELLAIQVDEHNDLAIVKAHGLSAKPGLLASDSDVSLGSEVMAVGFPLRGLLANRASVTTGVVSNLSGIANDARYLQITAPVQQGNSGGPLLNKAGRVVGIVVSKLDALTVAVATGDVPQNVNFAVKSSIVRTFLESSGVSFLQEVGGARLSGEQIGVVGQAITVPIDCWL